MNRPYGVIDGPLQVIFSIATPIISAVYLGVAKAAYRAAVDAAVGKADDDVVQRQIGLMAHKLRVASWALDGASGGRHRRRRRRDHVHVHHEQRLHQPVARDPMAADTRPGKGPRPRLAGLGRVSPLAGWSASLRCLGGATTDTARSHGR